MANQKTAVPDLIGDRGRARQLAQMLERIQLDRFAAEAAMIANDQTRDDFCGLHSQPGVAMTFGERLDNLDAAAERLVRTYPEAMPAVEALMRKAGDDA